MISLLFQSTYSHFQVLDEKINLVATKVVHLGDQLEGVNNPRAKAVEAKKLMNYMSEFLSDGPPKSDLFTDPFKVHLYNKANSSLKSNTNNICCCY
jgi:recyclin-1